MSPLSNDPERRARQLQNLRRGGTSLPGNQASRTHGGYSLVARGRLDAKAAEVYSALEEDLPIAASGVVVRLLAECLCRLDDVTAYLRDRGLLDAKGEFRAAVEVEARLRREAAEHADALGLTPRSMVRLGLDVARGRSLAERMADLDDDA